MSQNDKVDNLLEKVSKYLRKTPEEIKSAAQNGNIGDILNNLSRNDAENIQKIIKDKNLTEKLLSTKEAQKLVRDVFGGK